jgi:hypothetical protein
MAVRATHVPTGTLIEIGPHLDPTSQAVLNEAYGRCGIRDNAGVLECREHDDDPRFAHLRDEAGQVHGAWMYLRKLRDRWVICHHPKGIGRGLRDHEVHLMTDQHRWQQDYYERAAEAAGWSAEREVPIPGTRMDLVITGPAGRWAVEVQHSAMTTPKVKDRDRKARAADIATVWSADRKNPAWAFKVAHVETNELPHGHTPRGSWTVTTGPRRIEPARCSPANFERCWLPRRRNFCGGWHALFRPIEGLRVDDIAALVPAGDLVRLDTRTKQGVILATGDDADLWHHEFAAQVERVPSRRHDGAARRCAYDAAGLSLRSPTCQACTRPLLLIRPGRTLCERCRLDGRS